jgi:hypothetical protein
MKNRKITAVITAIVVVAALSVVAFAATAQTPAEILAGLTGQNVDDVISQRTQSGNTYGTLASEAGKLSEFQAQMLENKKAALQARVEAGRLTQEQADEILAQIEEHRADCDGTDCDGAGGGECGLMGGGFGSGFGAGQGRGQGQGGMGRGQGVCLGNE